MRLIPYAGSPVLNAAGTNGNGPSIPADLSIPEFMRRGAAAQKAVDNAIADAADPKPTGKLPVPPPSAKQDRAKGKDKDKPKSPPKPAAKPKRAPTAAKRAKAAIKAPPKAKRASEPRAGSKTAMAADLIRRPEGCTTADILKATDWPTVSLPAVAKAAGITLRKDKKPGEVTRYFAA
jgi:hypothetical protein